MKKVILLFLLSASGTCFGMDFNSENQRLNKLLERLSKQVIACSSLGHYVEGVWQYKVVGKMQGSSMWQPSNEKEVKESCDRIFARFVKVERQLSVGKNRK